MYWFQHWSEFRDVEKIFISWDYPFMRKEVQEAEKVFFFVQKPPPFLLNLNLTIHFPVKNKYKTGDPYITYLYCYLIAYVIMFVYFILRMFRKTNHLWWPLCVWTLFRFWEKTGEETPLAGKNNVKRTSKKVLLHNGGFWNTFVTKGIIKLMFIIDR
jgi:hypothetical protein